MIYIQSISPYKEKKLDLKCFFSFFEPLKKKRNSKGLLLFFLGFVVVVVVVVRLLESPHVVTTGHCNLAM